MEKIKQITKLSNEDKKKLLSKTAYVLPDNPSDKNWSPKLIKAKMYEGFLVMFDWLKELQEEIEENSQITNNNFNGIEPTFDGEKAIDKAVRDDEGNIIKETYATTQRMMEEIEKIKNDFENKYNGIDSEVIKDHISNEVIHVTEENKQNWNNKLDTSATINSSSIIKKF